MFKRFINHSFVQKSLALFLAKYMGLVRRTTRWSVSGEEHIQALQQSGQGFIACTWHSRFLMTTVGWTKMSQTPHVLISRSKDGNIVALTAQYLRLGVIRGSRVSKKKAATKNKGGTAALRDMIQVLENGDCIFMTPDGPKGPMMQMGQGPVRLSQFSGAPMIGYALSTSAKISLNTWDKFMIPLPFGRGKIIWTEAFRADEKANAKQCEDLRLHFENALNQASQQCDQYCGHTPIIPKNSADTNNGAQTQS